MLTIPEEVVKNLIEKLVQAKDDAGKRLYTNEQIAEMINKIDELARQKKFNLTRKSNELKPIGA